MDVQIDTDGSQPDSDQPDLDRSRGKTSQRLKYEAEIAVLKRDLGSLEDQRIRLGLSRRKICQILMVDPSAWTRWTTDGADAPPHVYQSLKWYSDGKARHAEKFEAYWEELKAENRGLHDNLLQIRKQFRSLKILVLIAAFLVIGSASASLIIYSLGLSRMF